MSTLPDAYRLLIEPLISTAREIVERGESLATMAFLGHLETGETRIVPILNDTEQQKDAASSAIRHNAHLIDADFVFTLAEGWGLPQDKLERFQQILDRYGSIGASPYRVDTVYFLLETHQGLWSAHLPFKPKGVSKKRRTFGRPEFTRAEEIHGRFVGLLPVKRADQGGTGRVH